jgi:hypothetical protein
MRVRTVLAVAALCLMAATGCHRHRKTAFPKAPAPVFKGSYAQSCRAITTLEGGFISAECANAHGRFDLTYLQAAACHGDIGNSNGTLVCNGAVASTTPPPKVSASAPAAAAAAATTAVGAAGLRP